MKEQKFDRSLFSEAFSRLHYAQPQLFPGHVNSVVQLGLGITQHTHRTIQAECQQHHKEYKRPEGRPGHGGYGSRVHHEHESRAFRGNVLDMAAGCMGHVTQHAEDHEAGDERGARVNHTGQDRVSVEVVSVSKTKFRK